MNDITTQNETVQNQNNPEQTNKKGSWTLGIFSVVLVLGLAIYFYYQYSFVKGLEGRSDKPLLKAIPSFAVEKLEGGSITKDDLFKNSPKLVMVHFWATWCSPCLVEFPQLANKLSSMASTQGFTAILIAINENAQNINKFLEKTGTKLPPNVIVAIDEKGQTQFDFGTVKIPETYLFNQKGETVDKFIGPQAWEDKFFADKIRANLPTTP